MEKRIKWGCIQPLTGGMYIGARNAVGHDAEWILSYTGLNSENKGKVGNEYHLTKWLQKQGISVPYYTFERNMFQNDFDMNPVIMCGGNEQTPEYADMDLVVAVPVCSGISMLTNASDETKTAKNCNMMYLAKYTLSVIKPKIYIFENAPTLMGNRGNEIRDMLEEIALENGYSVLYCITDSIHHDNCQHRPRTFVMFQKWQNSVIQEPALINRELKTVDLNEYLSRISKDATQKIPFEMSALNIALLAYSKHKYGCDWRDKSHKRPIIDIVNSNEYTQFKDFISKMTELSDLDKTKLYKFIDHAQYKKSIGMNFMSVDLCICKKDIPSVQFKCIQSMVHPTEDRLFSVRECLHFMGMPEDFELQGNISSNYMHIGQNVPVKTAEWICREAVKIIDNFNTINRKNGNNVVIFDNK